MDIAHYSLVILLRGKLAVTERNDASQTSLSSEKVFHKGYLFMCLEGSITFHMAILNLPCLLFR